VARAPPPHPRARHGFGLEDKLDLQVECEAGKKAQQFDHGAKQFTLGQQRVEAAQTHRADAHAHRGLPIPEQRAEHAAISKALVLSSQPGAIAHGNALPGAMTTDYLHRRIDDVADHLCQRAHAVRVLRDESAVIAQCGGGQFRFRAAATCTRFHQDVQGRCTQSDQVVDVAQYAAATAALFASEFLA